MLNNTVANQGYLEVDLQLVDQKVALHQQCDPQQKVALLE